ncbi:TetR/AcrR family transcriptional regulator [Algoriphagus sp.]|uniref:TetR/AcrR family transcriptional regulator n=1 Tax=Algoriphagus sp. TaxID=1872435 RepID=UPI0025ED71AB|nr:TetR/AcrR family transcriptional regulator [Algoriphagus sp.]
MIKSEINKGRVKQKLQTRLEILQAAKELMQKEKKITLEDVAKKAKISRATMYRYFSNIDLLFTEATLDLHHKTSEQIFEDVKDLPFAEKILYIQKHYFDLAQENETVFRRYLAAVLSESIVSNEPLRGARRMKSLNLALENYKGILNEDTFNKLINTTSVLTGIDSLITCKDVCNLDNEESYETLKWAMEMILKGIILDNQKIQ